MPLEDMEVDDETGSDEEIAEEESVEEGTEEREELECDFSAYTLFHEGSTGIVTIILLEKLNMQGVVLPNY